jgi:tetratricopeptide (TPR) repeat protein
MAAGQNPGFALDSRTIASAFAAMALLFGVTTIVVHWYQTERHARADRYFQIGESLARKGQNEAAVEQFRNALSISRNNPQYRLAIAETLMKVGRYEEAAIYFHELLQVSPGDAIPNLMLARIDMRERDTAAAIDSYHRAIYGRWPDNSRADRLEARWELVGVLAKSGESKQVLAELLAIAEDAPNDLTTQARAAHMLLEYGAAHQAAELFREVLRRNPHDADAEEGLGDAAMALNNDSLAQLEYRRALRDNPKDKAVRQKLTLVSDVLSLDPTARGLSSQERYRRSRAVAGRALAALEGCLAGLQPQPEAAKDAAAKAAKSLASRRPRSLDDAVDNNLNLADQLWTMKNDTCGADKETDPALERVLERVK